MPSFYHIVPILAHIMTPLEEPKPAKAKAALARFKKQEGLRLGWLGHPLVSLSVNQTCALRPGSTVPLRWLTEGACSSLPAGLADNKGKPQSRTLLQQTPFGVSARLEYNRLW